MRWFIISLISFILIFNFASAAFDLEIRKIGKGDVVVKELNNPAIYEFVITNNNESDIAQIYSLVGVSMTPKGTFAVPSGESRLEVWAWPDDSYRERDGLYSFEYQIKGDNQGIFRDKLTFRVVSLEDALVFENVVIRPKDKEVKITFSNSIDSNLENVEIQFSSVFFDFSEKVSLKPFETISVFSEIDLDKNSRLIAGDYKLNSNVKVEDIAIDFEGTINYLENEGTFVNEGSEGFFIKKKSVSKSNEGNVPTKMTIEMKKDIISRLFTSFSVDPTFSERRGLIVFYRWEKNIGPGDTFNVNSTTNYTFPFILIVLVVLVAFLVRVYTLTSVGVHKSVSNVKTKGGEFALKIRIIVKARKDLDNVRITDRLPGMTKLYDKFGRKPDKIDKENRKLTWEIFKLNKGEERVFSYVVYSKLRAVGKFELPAVHVDFERDGEKEEVYSNRAFFVSETAGED
jgi:hypothetical protein